MEKLLKEKSKEYKTAKGLMHSAKMWTTAAGVAYTVPCNTAIHGASLYTHKQGLKFCEYDVEEVAR